MNKMQTMIIYPYVIRKYFFSQDGIGSVLIYTLCREELFRFYYVFFVSI